MVHNFAKDTIEKVTGSHLQSFKRQFFENVDDKQRG